MNAREAMAELQAAPKFGNQVELLNIVERALSNHERAIDRLQTVVHWLADPSKAAASDKRGIAAIERVAKQVLDLLTTPETLK